MKVEFKLTDYNTKDELKRAIDRLQYQGQGTRTGDALMKLVNTIFQTQNGMRDDAAIPKVKLLQNKFSVPINSRLIESTTEYNRVYNTNF